MRTCKLATALTLFAAFTYAQEEETTQEVTTQNEREEEKLIDISEEWDKLIQDEGLIGVQQQIQAFDAELYDEYWGYVEEVVAIVDAAVDAQALTNTDFYDLEDFFMSLDEDAFADLNAELQEVTGAFTDFVAGLQSNTDLQNAIANIVTLWMGEDGSSDVPYIAMFMGQGSDEVNAAMGNIMAIILDDTGAPKADIDVQAVMTELETFFALDDVQSALAATFVEILAAWNAVKDDAAAIVQTIEDSFDGLVTGYDALVSDEIHETSQKLIDIAHDVITDIEDSESIQGALTDIKGQVDRVNGWINQDDWNTVYDGVTDQVKGVYDVLKEDLEQGLPERNYPWIEDEVVPDNAFSFAASATALLASVAAISF